jgi:hypothetical protein
LKLDAHNINQVYGCYYMVHIHSKWVESEYWIGSQTRCASLKHV